MEYFDLKSIYIIVHVFGAIIGAGGAYMSDVMFFASARDKKISSKEIEFLRIGSAFVWVGIFISVVSGILIFSTNPQFYINSDKFLLKNLVVLVIILNGIYFHKWHMPVLHRHADKHYPTSREFKTHKKFLITSGVISFSSWTFAIILGLLNSVPFSLSEGILYYIIFEIIAIFVFFIFFRKSF